jgi:hypothetical protein
MVGESTIVLSLPRGEFLTAVGEEEEEEIVEN